MEKCMAKLYNKLTQIMGHAFSFNFTLCNFSLVPGLFFTREAKIGLAQDYCTPQEQECYKFVMPRSDLGTGLGMKLKFDLPVPAYIAFKHGSHTYCMYQCQCTSVQDKTLIGCIPQSINLISLTVCVYLHPSVGRGGGEVDV